MGNIIKIPDLNPVQFYWAQRPFEIGKNQYFMWEDWFKNQLPYWYTQSKYRQKWQRSDYIYLQIQSNATPINWQVINCKKQEIMSGEFTNVQGVPPGQIYNYLEAKIQLADSAFDGVDEFYVIITLYDGSTIVSQHVSEPMIVSDSFRETIKFEYYFPKGKYEEVWFNDDTRFMIRVEARVKDYQPGAIIKVYTDQMVNLVPLSRHSFDQYTLSVGHSYGVPPFVIKKLNTLFNCLSVFIEGSQFALTSESTWEANRLALYGMAGYSITIQPTINRGYDYSDTSLNDQVAVAYNIDGKVVGIFSGQASETSITIISAE